MDTQERYDELIRKLHSQNDTYKKYKRRTLNEPESEGKYAKLELIDLVLNRSEEIVNWWDNYEVKMQRKKELAEAEARKAETKKKVDEYISSKTASQDFNTKCRYFSQLDNDIICECGMDMCFCGIKCAFATNRAGHTKAYEAPIIENHRPARRRIDE